MRATVIFAFFFALVASLVGAVPSRGLNARRLARGLGPLPPVRRSPTKVEGKYPSVRCSTPILTRRKQWRPGSSPLVLLSATAAISSAVRPSLVSQAELSDSGCIGDSVHSSNDDAVSALLGHLGIGLGLTSIVGMDCSPLSVLALSGNSW